MNQQLTLPVKFNRKEYSLEDLDLYCLCGHYVNGHSNGLGGGESICDTECGCIYCELDYEYSVAMNYFQGVYDRWLIVRMNADATKFKTMTMDGLPVIKEPYEMTITQYRDGDVTK